MMKKLEVLKALRDVQSYVELVQNKVDGEARTVLDQLKDEASKAKAHSDAMVLAILSDQPCPASLFAEWASVRAIRDWGHSNKLKTEILHGRTCVRPSDFFTFFKTLTGSSAKEPGTTPASV